MTDPVQPPTSPTPLHTAQIISRHHPDRGPCQHVRIEFDVTSMGDARQKLLLHYAFRAMFECQHAIEQMTLTDVRLALAKIESKSGAKTVANGEPTPGDAQP